MVPNETDSEEVLRGDLHKETNTNGKVGKNDPHTFVLY